MSRNDKQAKGNHKKTEHIKNDIDQTIDDDTKEQIVDEFIKDIDMIDDECNLDENEEEQHIDNDNYESSFLSLTIGERVLLLRIISIILPHQTGYHLLLCFQRYSRIFGDHYICEILLI